jgi:hypothetical protein
LAEAISAAFRAIKCFAVSFGATILSNLGSP